MLDRDDSELWDDAYDENDCVESDLKKKDNYGHHGAFSPSDRNPAGLPEFEVLDIETSTDGKNCYMVGWTDGTGGIGNGCDRGGYRFWESPLLPPDDPRSAVGMFCHWYFNGKKHRPPIYAHNGGNFDFLYILKWLESNCPALINIIPAQSAILQMKVKVDKKGKKVFRDSARLMPGSLDKLMKAFLGKGKLGEIDYETLHTDPRRYEYLEYDCRGLHACIEKFRDLVTGPLGGEMGITNSSTAIRTLQHGYLKRSIKRLSYEDAEFVTRGYYGGRTEVFHRGGKFQEGSRLHCFDINSMYPWAMAQPMPVDPLFPDEGRQPGQVPDLDEPAFVECLVATTGADEFARKYPILPWRGENKLLFPLGRFTGVWTSEELKYAYDHGYRFSRVGKVVRFGKCEVVFKDFVDKLYALKDRSNPGYDDSVALIAKMLLNSAYGKFGTRKEKTTIIVDPFITEDAVQRRGLRMIDGPYDMDVYVEDVVIDGDYMLPHLAAWITSLARIRLSRFMEMCGNFQVYYTDTDCIYTVADLPTGTGLGVMKLEHAEIEEARFAAPKAYRLMHVGKPESVKVKGFSQFGKGFDPKDFDALERGEPIVCSRMTKFRTVLKGKDFGIVKKTKHMLEQVNKRDFAEDGSSTPLVIDEIDEKVK
jgi:hypothetical protein